MVPRRHGILSIPVRGGSALHHIRGRWNTREHFQVEFARRDAGRRVEEDDGDVQVRGDERETVVSRADQKGQDGGGGRAENGPDDRHREGEDRRGRAVTGELHDGQLEARLRHYVEVEQGSHRER